MSWSFNAIGRPAAVAAKLKADLARNKCVEPEETIKNTIVDLVGIALAAYPDGAVVKVEAYGSQSTVLTQSTHSLKLELTTIHEFVE